MCHLQSEPWSTKEGQMVEATSPSLKQGSLPQLVRHPSLESKAEETLKKGKLIAIENPVEVSISFGLKMMINI